MRIFTFAIAFLLANSLFAVGQTTGEISAEVRVNAEVIQSIELITVNSMQFGEVQPGQRELIISPINDTEAGFMIAQGTPEAEFRLNYLPAREIAQISGNNYLTFNYEISGSTENEQTTSELIEIDSRNLQFNSEGRYYIWIGGHIILENAAPGNYEGDFTIEIDYI